MVVWVLSIAGDQDPVILLVDIIGKTGIELPKQYGSIPANVGVMLWSIEMVRVVASPH